MFGYGVKRDQYEKLYQRILGTTCYRLLQKHFFNWYWDPGKEHTPPWWGRWRTNSLYFPCTSFFSSISTSVAARTIYNITLNSALSISYTLETYIIVYHHTSKEEESREGGKYNRLTAGYFSGRVSIMEIYASREASTRIHTIANKLSVIVLQHIMTP